MSVTHDVSSPLDPLAGLLADAERGSKQALDEAFVRVYSALRRVAHARHRRSAHEDTLVTTALVHEVYLKLQRSSQLVWHDEQHLLAIASRAMRQILVNYATRRRRGRDIIEIIAREELNPVTEADAERLLALEEALRHLEASDAELVRLIEARYYCGLSIEEAARTLGVSPATAKRRWALARAWLRRHLDGDRVG